MLNRFGSLLRDAWLWMVIGCCLSLLVIASWRQRLWTYFGKRNATNEHWSGDCNEPDADEHLPPSYPPDWR